MNRCLVRELRHQIGRVFTAQANEHQPKWTHTSHGSTHRTISLTTRAYQHRSCVPRLFVWCFQIIFSISLNLYELSLLLLQITLFRNFYYSDTRKWKSEQIKPEAASMAQHALIPPPPHANRSKDADEIDSTAIELLSNEPIQAPRTHKFLLCPKNGKKKRKKKRKERKR